MIKLNKYKINRITIFGGTFDPPHKGHLNIANFITSTRRSNKVIFVPAYKPCHKCNIHIAPYTHRLRMCQLMTRHLKNIDTSDIERYIHKDPIYTVDLLEEVKKKYARSKISLLIGSDSLAKLHTWKNYKEIYRNYEIFVYPRNILFDIDDEIEEFIKTIQEDYDDFLIAQKNIKILPVTEMFPINSTDIRLVIGGSKNLTYNDMKDSLTRDVFKYINEKEIYSYELSRSDKTNKRSQGNKRKEEITIDLHR